MLRCGRARAAGCRTAVLTRKCHQCGREQSPRLRCAAAGTRRLRSWPTRALRARPCGAAARWADVGAERDADASRPPCAVPAWRLRGACASLLPRIAAACVHPQSCCTRACVRQAAGSGRRARRSPNSPHPLLLHAFAAMPAVIGKPAPAFAANSVQPDGSFKTVSLADYKGAAGDEQRAGSRLPALARWRADALTPRQASTRCSSSTRWISPSCARCAPREHAMMACRA